MRKVFVIVYAMLCCVLFAGNAVSPAFTFDARYESSGITPNAWVAYQAEGLSTRFTTATVTHFVDTVRRVDKRWDMMRTF